LKRAGSQEAIFALEKKLSSKIEPSKPQSPRKMKMNPMQLLSMRLTLAFHLILLKTTEYKVGAESKQTKKKNQLVD
jgi:hypothetical protein